MRKPQPTGTAPRRLRAVGYVRVSTDQQAQEGSAWRRSRPASARTASAKRSSSSTSSSTTAIRPKSLERPGVKRVLAMLTAGRADAVVVVKLDRLTCSVKDLGILLDTYFREGLPYSLLSVSDAIDTRSAGGKLLLNVLMSVAQWERTDQRAHTRP